MLLLLVPALSHATTDADIQTAYTTCNLDPDCRALYHQYPPNYDVFYSIYTRVNTDGDSRTYALRARVARLVLCARNEQYEVDPVTHEGVCMCPEDGPFCGPVTPHNNAVVVLACIATTLAMLLHAL